MIGESLSGYLIEKEIAVTNTGTVYLAKDVLHVPRAIKIIHPALAAKETVRNRFRHALRAWAKLDHPNLVHVFMALDDEHTLGAIMNFVDGTLLKEMLNQQGKLGISQAMDYFLQIARAILFLHKNQILHRKLSPENIIVCKDETVKVLGLGAAKTIGTPRITPEKLCVGKVKYMAPEQFEGTYSILSDQYSLGAILYEMITGKPPYEAKTIPELYRMHLTAQPVLPKKINPEVNVDLQNIILKMIAKKPSNRFPDLSSVIEALTDATDRIDFSEDMSLHSLMFRGRRSLERRHLDNSIFFFHKVLSLYGRESSCYSEALQKLNQAFEWQQEERDIIKIRSMIQDALAYFDDGDFEHAREYVRKILDIMRNYPESSRMRGLRMDISKEMPEIVAEASDWLDKQIAKSNMATEKAATLIEEEKYNEAKDILEEALLYDAKNKKAWKYRYIVEKKISIRSRVELFRAGLQFFQQKQYGEAIENFEKILQQKPSDTKIKEFIQLANQEIEKEKKKKSDIEQYYREGRELYEHWEYAKALEKFQQLLTLDPNHEEAKKYLELLQDRLSDDTRIQDISFFYGQGLQFFNQGKWKEAITCFNRVLSVMSTHKKALEYKQMSEKYLEAR